MYKKVLIATDGSTFADHAVKHGLELAKVMGGSVIFVTVTEIWSALDMAHKSKVGVQDPISEFENKSAEVAKNILSAAEAAANQVGVSSESIHIKDKHPADGIIDAATSKGCDLIVMASHGRRGIQKVLLGSVASEVLTHSKLPVLIVKQQ